MNSTTANSIWAHEKAPERCKELCLQGLSASQIAKQLATEFRHPVSRNAVIGKLFRMGVQHPGRPADPGKRKAISAPPVKIPKPTPEKAAERKRMTSEAQAMVQRIEQRRAEMGEPPLEAIVISLGRPGPGAKRLEALGTQECHWPLGDGAGGQLFCAAAYPDDSRRQPYCDCHLEDSISLAWMKKKAAKATDLTRDLRRYI